MRSILPMKVYRRQLVITAMASLCLVAVSGCSLIPPAPAQIGSPTSTSIASSAPLVFHIVRYSSGRMGIPPFARQVNDSSKAQQFYQYILGMAPAPQLASCPNDIGGGYLINFTRADAIVLQALMPASGCPYLALSSPNSCRFLNQAFTQYLAQLLGVTSDDLWVRNNTAAPGGPVAPVDPPKPWLWSSCLPNNG